MFWNNDFVVLLLFVSSGRFMWMNDILFYNIHDGLTTANNVSGLYVGRFQSASFMRSIVLTILIWCVLKK